VPFRVIASGTAFHILPHRSTTLRERVHYLRSWHQMFEQVPARGIRIEAGTTKGLKNEDLPRHVTGRSPFADRRLSRVAQARTPMRRNQSMADNKSGPAEAVKGVVEDVKGRAKEAVGAVTGRDDLTREGQAQQDKAEAQRNAAKKEAEANAARGSAKVAEERQKSNQ
jgi:uncharacterized protein YjbJ (UPF0337 family)